MRLRERPRILAEIDREVEEGHADLKRLLSELEAKKLFSFSLIEVKFTFCWLQGVLRCPITSEEQVFTLSLSLSAHISFG